MAKFNNTKIDTKRWYEMQYDEPPKRGKYLITVGVLNRVVCCHQTGVVEAFWNGKAWGIPAHYRVYRWKYTTPNEIDKYPDFEANLRFTKEMISKEYELSDDREESIC